MQATFDAIGLVTDDLPRALAFYRHLGLDVPEDASGPHAEVALPGGLRLMFDTRASIVAMDPAWRDPQGSPRAALAFACPAPADVDAGFAELVAAGGAPHQPPFDAPWAPFRYATLFDPDGNGIDLFAALPTP